MATITLTFANEVNRSLQVGGNANARDSVFTKIGSNTFYLGDVSAISADRKTITVDFTASDYPRFPGTSDFVFFVKKADVCNTKLTGYYAEVQMKNTSTEKAELFSVGSEIAVSSK
tara:strand:- start:173 stop:520 length:348 start_codon:yes stop_codon:yes gene_type:complete